VMSSRSLHKNFYLIPFYLQAVQIL
jgi:hypothetical protein